MNVKKQEHIIKNVIKGSIAEEMEMEPGDCLVAINGEEIEASASISLERIAFL